MNMILQHPVKLIKTEYISPAKNMYIASWEAEGIDSWDYIPGQFYVFEFTINGVYYRRPYSGSALPGSKILQTTIREVGKDNAVVSKLLPLYGLQYQDAGQFSAVITGPSGTFYLREYDSAENLIFIVSGSAWGVITSMYVELAALLKKGSNVLIDLSVNNIFDVPSNWYQVIQALEPLGAVMRLSFYEQEDLAAYKLTEQETEKADVYLCGSPFMIQAVEEKCLQLGNTKNVYKEHYFKKV